MPMALQARGSSSCRYYRGRAGSILPQNVWNEEVIGYLVVLGSAHGPSREEW